MDSATDVQSGRVSADSPGGDGGWDEHPGDCADVWPAPGHGAQDAGLFGPAGLSPAVSAKEAQAGAFYRRHRPDPGGRPKASQEAAPHGQAHLRAVRDEYGFDGGYTTVKDYVRENRRQIREMFVPLSHPPGHAQCDFGEALVVIGGVERKAHCFVLDLPHSDGCFVKACPAESTEASWTGTYQRSRSWSECPGASSTTIPGWPWRRYWGTAVASAPGPSPNCSPTTCSRTGSGAPARVMTKARWRVWWGTRGAISGAHPVFREL